MVASHLEASLSRTFQIAAVFRVYEVFALGCLYVNEFYPAVFLYFVPVNFPVVVRHVYSAVVAARNRSC